MKLAFLQEIYDYEGPFATVYLDTSAESEDAGKALELRWCGARESLSRRGAGEADLRALESAVASHESRTGRRGQVLVAAEGSVVFSDELPEPPEHFPSDAGVSFGRLPHLLPYLAMRQARIPHVVAVVDRLGADLTIVQANQHVMRSSVDGDDNPHHKSHAAGQGDEKRHHQRVEERWKANAKLIADEITRRVREYRAEVVVLAGDVEQRKLVGDQLEAHVRELVIATAAGHRRRGALDAPLREEIAEAVDTTLQQRVDRAVVEFEKERGNRAHVAEGWQETVDALLHGQVRALLWSREAYGLADHGMLSIGSEPNHVAFEDATLVALGAAWVEHVAAEDALIRAASCTGADLVLPAPREVELADGVGAVLRYADSTR
ncbi:Vms1/Ankzf1 family peptidyl-tRNA hydrolase [Haloechinothrix sp. LS1_15]|uniref:baeRF2 domain-containing protein n=1 Tax=Haloechinothrix sp. LS1_15 TaxID=2652248 RepID=UPI002944A634|nr:Vms1/Ankzf1 family peptidyl-tRNA hydrolase [Haloechinothrix sp. LS1_15]MDV6012910.1 hypothetical protein [Haloechinothrix sp. LS1_15]